MMSRTEVAEASANQQRFLANAAQQNGRPSMRFDDGGMQALAGYSFPGNVRQLENICHWLTVMAPAQVIEVKDLPPEVVAMPAALESAEGAVPVLVGGMGLASPVASTSAPVLALAAQENAWEQLLEREALRLLAEDRNDVWDVLSRQFESRLIQTALSTTRGRRIEAAQRLGIGRNTITRKIQELGIDD